ncbi:hypothetical protein [Novosphingobium lindaniclasticum]|uniref:Uncharacterized protein n=1 Tax=Novosphingobium lindaniclasticum LE124 TaxID=1096930 RepID=T0HC24_9SPHN|nr:hypothetical protein [Novosphingobium lindaniclasticum]EQB13871.1 hypothetical protein L284_13755 [Novosphingobium lindaniclasticum LE124]
MNNNLLSLKARLGAQTVKLMDEILEKSEGTLAARMLRAGEAPFENVAAGLDINDYTSVLLIKDFETVPEAAVIHELLHLQRYWVEGVPQLIGGDHAMQQSIGLIENSLEHLVIVPRQSGFERQDPEYWDAGSRQEWEEFFPQWLMLDRSGLPFKRRLLMAWLRTHIVTDGCQPARKTDPLSAPNIDPTFRQRGGYPGSR